jgi:hypothetical protein
VRVTRFDWWPEPSFQLGSDQPGPLVLCYFCGKSRDHQIHCDGSHVFRPCRCPVEDCNRWATEINPARKIGPVCGAHYAEQRRKQDEEIEQRRKRRDLLDMEKETAEGLKWLAERLEQNMFGEREEPQTLIMSPQAFKELEEALEEPRPILYAKEDAKTTLELYKHQAAAISVIKEREAVGLPSFPGLSGSIRFAMDSAFPEDSMLLVGKTGVMTKNLKKDDDDG